MSDITTFMLNPPITLGEADHRRLLALTEAGAGPAEDLLAEIERAEVVPGEWLPADVVRMGSGVRYRTADGEERAVTLVYPGKADIASGRVSVLTPIGTALIGLRRGQSITWIARDGSRRVLTVLAVFDPEEDDSGPAAA